MLSTEPDQSINMDMILEYVENTLDTDDKLAVERTILNNDDLIAEIVLLKRLVEDQPCIDPPAQLHTDVLKKLGLYKNYVMDIILKKAGDVMDILSGGQFYEPDLAKAAIPVRGTAQQLYIFKSTQGDYTVTCRVQSVKSQEQIYFTMEDLQGESVKNGRFSVSRDGAELFEVITDSTGSTSFHHIKSGSYEIEFSAGRKQIGTIKLSIS